MITPRSYQEKGITKLYGALQAHGSALDMSDMGTGKTYKALFIAKKANTAVAVVCPAGTITQWKKAANETGVKVRFITSYEKAVLGTQDGITRKGVKRKLYTFQVQPETLWIFDEVHRCRNHKSLSAILLISVIDREFPCLMLSATPFENPTQFRAIGHALGTVHKNAWYLWCLSSAFCARGQYGGLNYLGGAAFMDQLRERISPQTDRVRLADVGDLPELRFQTCSIEVEDTKAIDEAYVDLLKTHEEETTSALEVRLRQRQIIEHQKIQSLFALADEYLQAGQRVIHFVNFTDTVVHLKGLHRLNKQNFGVFDGKVKREEREADVEKYLEGNLDGLIVNIQSGGVGLSLPDVSGSRPTTSILNLTDSATWFRQATGRTYRENTKSNCRIVVPLAYGTIEEAEIQEKDNLDC